MRCSWNAARSFANFLDLHSDQYCKGKRILELGAGGGLPGIVAALTGAESVRGKPISWWRWLILLGRQC